MELQDYRKLGINLATQYLQELELEEDLFNRSILKCNLITAIHMAGYSNLEDFEKEIGLNT